MFQSKCCQQSIIALICTCLLLFFSACQTTTMPLAESSAHSTSSPTTGTHQDATALASHTSTPTIVPTPTRGTSPINTSRPVLAFYYTWYSPSTWCLCHMSDLPLSKYDSSNDATIDRQVTLAANAGITGFVSSWWGPGDKTDKNFVKLLVHAAALQKRTGYSFASTIYFESSSPQLNTVDSMVSGLRYVLSRYSHDPHFFHWHGKPVLFVAEPLQHGRSISMWASIRGQVDPNNQVIWSAEGVDMQLLDVFDGIHLFSAAYWGILDGDITVVDQGFRNKIDAYNRAHHTQKMWVAGVLPGYDDTRVPGRQGTYIVPRRNGATYRTSWNGALASNPDWITITTFNEWFEGAMIEPSIHYGNFYLDITRAFAKRWHG